MLEGIIKGKLRYKMSKNMQSAMPIGKLSAETKKEMIRLAAEKLGKQDQLFVYALLTGDAAGMKAARADMSPEAKKIARQYIYEFTNTLKLTLERVSPGKRDKLAELLGKIPDFKSLF